MNDDHKNETPNAIDVAVERSSEQILDIEDLILFSSDPIRGARNLLYFITTVDLVAGLYYSPLCNLDASKLNSLLGERRAQNDDRLSIIESIRSLFPFSEREAPHSWAICQQFLSLESNDRGILLVEIDPNGLIVRGHFPGTLSTVGPLRSLIQQQSDDGCSINTKVNEGMEALRTDECTDWNKFLLFNVDKHIPKKTPTRKSGLMQLGFCFAASTSTPQDIEDIADRLRTCCHMSAYASWVLFLERERYYRKALRQAVKGHLTKFGDATNITEQVQKLRVLNGQFELVPQVLLADPQIPEPSANAMAQRQENGDAHLAWYRMTRFTMPSLLDILTSTEGLERHEIRSLVRACLTHLDCTYWQSIQWGEETNSHPYICSVLRLALGRVRSTCVNIDQHAKTISRGIPTKFKRVIELFSPDDVIRYRWPIGWILPRRRSKRAITLHWDETHNFQRTCQHPIKALEGLLAQVKQMQLPSVRRLVSVSEDLHGDAHFGNFLVDASVPEDPLLVSIDPLVVKVSPSDLKANEAESLRPDLEAECAWFKSDPLYDVAKLLVSTVCAYGIVLRGALTAQTDRQFVLEYNENAQPRQLSDTAGISGDQLVAVTATVPRVAWEYHSYAARSVFDQWEDILELLQGGDTYSIAASHIRLWLLTVRHGFSLADHLFPQEIEKSLSMFLLVTLFLNEGLKPVSHLLSNNLEDEDSVKQLSKLFQTGVASLNISPKADPGSEW